MSERRFGIVNTLSGLSQGIIVNNITSNINSQIAQARDEKGKLIDIAAYDEEREFTIDGLYTNEGLDIGTVVTVDDKNYLITSRSRTESNTSFETASLVARLYPEGGSIIPYDPPEENPPLTFKALETAGINLISVGTPDEININFKKNGGNWSPYTIGQSIVLNQGEKVAFSGDNSTFSKNGSNYYQFVMVGQISGYGNIQSLMGQRSSVSPSCYYRLFNGCSGLVTPPVLSATTLATGCYKAMFINCTSLTTAPQLPATTIAQSCYSNMFYGCSNLATAVQLPATTLQIDCYNYMFCGCSKLANITVSFTNWNVITATNNWLSGVATIGVFNKPSNLSLSSGVSYIPEGWTVNDK